MQWPVWQSVAAVQVAPGPSLAAPRLGMHPSDQPTARQKPFGPKMPALLPKAVPGFGLFAVVLQVATQLLEPVQFASEVHFFAVSTEAIVVVLYGAQTRGVLASAERPAQLALLVQAAPMQTPGFTLPTTPRSPVLIGESGSAAVVEQIEPDAQSPLAEGRHAPRQMPSVAVAPVLVTPSSIASIVEAVRQTPLSHAAPPEQAEPALPAPETGPQMACHELPPKTGEGWQLPAGQSRSSRQVGSQVPTTPVASPSE